jgi:hypothetical protein
MPTPPPTTTPTAPAKTAKPPKADPPRCDVYGCGHHAAMCTDGTEEDVQGLGRKSLSNLNVCVRHTNWPHSEDARLFAQISDAYKART